MLEKLTPEIEPGQNIWATPEVQANIRKYLYEYSVGGIFHKYNNAVRQLAENCLSEPHTEATVNWYRNTAATALNTLHMELPIIATKLFASASYDADNVWRSNYVIDLAKANPNDGRAVDGSFIRVCYVNEDCEPTDYGRNYDSAFSDEETALLISQFKDLEKLGAVVEFPDEEFNARLISSLRSGA